MTLIRITGSQLHAAWVLVGLSREEVAERAGLCRHSIRSWENSSHAIPGATYSQLCRVVDVLAARARASAAMGYLQRTSHQLRTIARVYMSASLTPAYEPRRV